MTLRTLGTGNIILRGTSEGNGIDSDGVELRQPQIESGGNINITGISNGINDSQGIHLRGATLETTGEGNVLLDGTSLNLGENNHGILLFEPTISTIVRTLGSGEITVTGSSNNGSGIFIGNSQVQSGGNVEFTGTTTSTEGGLGVIMSNSTVETTGNGNILLDGTNLGTGLNNDGIRLDGRFGGMTLRTLGTGNIILRGTSNSSGNGSDGVSLRDSQILSGGGINITGIGGTGANSFGFTSTNTILRSETGSISITSTSNGLNLDSFFFDENSALQLPNSGEISLTSNRDIRPPNLNIPGATINLTSTEGNIILSDGIDVSNPQGNGGQLTFNGNVVLTRPDTILRTVGLTTSGDIIFNGSINDIVANTNQLTLDAGTGNITLRTVGNTSPIAGLQITGNNIIGTGSITIGSEGTRINAAGTANFGDIINTTGTTNINAVENITTNDITALEIDLTSFQQNIITGNLSTASETTAGGSINLNATQGGIFTGNLTSTGTAGGGIDLRALTTIVVGQINASGTIGDGGDVILDPIGDVEIEWVRTEGGAEGNGGDFFVESRGGFFRAIETFDTPFGRASISTTSPNQSGTITIIHAGGELETPVAPFQVGDSSVNGTEGAIIGDSIIPLGTVLPESTTIGNIRIQTDDITPTPEPIPEEPELTPTPEPETTPEPEPTPVVQTPPDDELPTPTPTPEPTLTPERGNDLISPEGSELIPPEDPEFTPAPVSPSIEPTPTSVGPFIPEPTPTPTPTPPPEPPTPSPTPTPTPSPEPPTPTPPLTPIIPTPTPPPPTPPTPTPTPPTPDPTSSDISKLPSEDERDDIIPREIDSEETMSAEEEINSLDIRMEMSDTEMIEISVAEMEEDYTQEFQEYAQGYFSGSSSRSTRSRTVSNRKSNGNSTTSSSPSTDSQTVESNQNSTSSSPSLNDPEPTESNPDSTASVPRSTNPEPADLERGESTPPSPPSTNPEITDSNPDSTPETTDSNPNSTSEIIESNRNLILSGSRSTNSEITESNQDSTLTLATAQVTLRELTDRIGIKPALVYTRFVEGQLELILVTAYAPPVVERPGVTRAEIQQVVQDFRQEVIKPRNPSPENAQQLYRWLILPLEKHLDQLNADDKSIGINLSFIMSPELRNLPLAALRDEQGKYLVEKYSLGFMPSLSLTNTVASDITNAEILAMGSDEFPESSDLTLEAALPQAEFSLQTILKLWSGNLNASSNLEGQLLINESFTRENFNQARRSRNFGVIHLATHAAFKGGNSAYIRTWNEQLSIEKMRELALSKPFVRLLVLTACETAVGNREADLGFAGVAYNTGVQTVLGSLWKVPANETLLLLMTDFYYQLSQGKIKSEALRQAQINLLKGYTRIEQQGEDLVLIIAENPDNPSASSPPPIIIPEHLSQGIEEIYEEGYPPYYWAGFTMIGSPW
ncbi:MAG: CHAT domain-containing protein [Cyanobacteria bacterium J06592_8]